MAEITKKMAPDATPAPKKDAPPAPILVELFAHSRYMLHGAGPFEKGVVYECTPSEAAELLAHTGENGAPVFRKYKALPPVRTTADGAPVSKVPTKASESVEAKPGRPPKPAKLEISTPEEDAEIDALVSAGLKEEGATVEV
jgi:hypothetical protein